jgi:leucyl-tRNA synthetase
MAEFNFSKIEKKWQKRWNDEETFYVSEDPKKKKFYSLEMFPYPSGSGLHMGHALNYTIGDIIARYKIMQGYNVLHPIGFDALGLPAENAAIKEGTHPQDYTKNSIKNFVIQQKRLGLTYDWGRVVDTSNPDYYRWDQWIFLKMLESGLAYQKESLVNWCPECKTVLANEQVVDGKCWRHEKTSVESKYLKQWFFKLTNYADELLDNLDNMNWPETTKSMQKHWIGKSYGTEIDFEVETQTSKVVVVHGGNAEKDKDYNKHWMPWLKSELAKKNIDSKFPQMPVDSKATYEEWRKIFDKIKIDKNSILVGHSRGAAFLVRWLGETKTKIKKLILVAPCKFARVDYKKTFYDFDINSLVKDSVGEVIIFSSDNDENYILKSVEEYHNTLGGKVLELNGRGHFLIDKFPELLSEILAGEKWPVFTTRPDTIYGVTFVVISPYHRELKRLVTSDHKKEVEGFLKKLKSISEKDLADLEKEGAFTGSYAINPVNGEKVPIYMGNFVIADYGSGMVMAVPAHDKRDYEFAKKYGIPIKIVIDPVDFELNDGNLTEAYTGEGTLINSGRFNGIENEKAKEEITNFLKEQGSGKKSVQFRLKDWGISRQRYWGTPIPVVHCERCGVVPVSYEDLPVKLPKNVSFGEGNPLLTNDKWINVKCPKCDGKAKRETDTMDTFVNSSWYFLRYTDPHNNKEIFDKEKASYWCPPDIYIGGAEHACMHLIYSRYYVKFLRDLGLIRFDEPAVRLFHQGMLHGEGGDKMSKSKGNVVNPLDTISKYGADSLRLFLVSVASPDKDFDWSEKGIQGSFRLIKRIYDFFVKTKPGRTSKELELKMNNSIKYFGERIENFDYRKVTIALRELFEELSKEKEVGKKVLEDFLKLLSPFCPHIAEELWEKLGNSSFISTSKWPEFKEGELNQKAGVNLNSQVINYVLPIMRKLEGRGDKVSKVHLYFLPFEIGDLDKKRFEKELGKEVFIYSVQDNNKYDPQGRAKKAKPGMPGIWFE